MATLAPSRASAVGARPAEPAACAHHQGGPPRDPELHPGDAIRCPPRAPVGYGERDGGDGDLYEQLVDAANAIYGSHPHSRALHAKGTWCEGSFTASPEAAQLCRALHFQGDPVPALVRFSNGSGDPESNDAAREARGMAVKLRPEAGDETDILGTSNPSFATRTPEEFLELLRLRRPDPETGQPDWEKLGAFLAAHPESQPAIQATINTEPPASRAQVAYRSPHSFKLVDAAGEGTWVRYRWRPEAGEAQIPDDEAQERGRDYLREELAERLRAGPARVRAAVPDRRRGRSHRRSHRHLARGARARRRRPARDHRDRRRPRVRRPHRRLRPDPGRRRHRALQRPDPARPRQGLLGLGLSPPGGRGGEPVDPADVAVAVRARRPRARDQVHAGIITRPGRLAQLGERLVYNQEVAGSSPAPPIGQKALEQGVSMPSADKATGGGERRAWFQCPLVPIAVASCALG